jgi:hypothetical protein
MRPVLLPPDDPSYDVVKAWLTQVERSSAASGRSGLIRRANSTRPRSIALIASRPTFWRRGSPHLPEPQEEVS